MNKSCRKSEWCGARRACVLVIVLLAISSLGAAEDSSSRRVTSVDLYLFSGEWPIWVGTTISYTVFEPVRVEGRVLSATGEIIAVLQEGVKQPGVYTLPFDGNYHGAQLAGYYSFELYFDDDFAFQSQLVAIPAALEG